MNNNLYLDNLENHEPEEMIEKTIEEFEEVIEVLKGFLELDLKSITVKDERFVELVQKYIEESGDSINMIIQLNKILNVFTVDTLGGMFNKMARQKERNE